MQFLNGRNYDLDLIAPPLPQTSVWLLGLFSSVVLTLLLVHVHKGSLKTTDLAHVELQATVEVSAEVLESFPSG